MRVILRGEEKGGKGDSLWSASATKTKEDNVRRKRQRQIAVVNKLSNEVVMKR